MSRRQRSLVANAADPAQVAQATRVLGKRENVFEASLQVVLQSAEGRLVLWGIIEGAGVFESIWDPSAKIHYNAGRQDYGHRLRNNCMLADPDAYQLMEREARARDRKEEAGTAAIQQQAPQTEGVTT